MSVETVRAFCLTLPGATEDVKWGADLCFLVGGRMFAVMNLEPPHQISFKTTPEAFAELVERDGLKPAPYLARAMWVQQEALGEALGRRELETLIRQSYGLIAAKLPKSLRGRGAKRGRATRSARSAGAVPGKPAAAIKRSGRR